MARVDPKTTAETSTRAKRILTQTSNDRPKLSSTRHGNTNKRNRAYRKNLNRGGPTSGEIPRLAPRNSLTQFAPFMNYKRSWPQNTRIRKARQLAFRLAIQNSFDSDCHRHWAKATVSRSPICAFDFGSSPNFFSMNITPRFSSEGGRRSRQGTGLAHASHVTGDLVCCKR